MTDLFFSRKLAIGIFFAVLVCFLGFNVLQFDASANSPESSSAYFPKNEFANLTYDAFLVGEFEKHLRFLKEPLIYRKDAATFQIRCMWMSPYGGDQLVRIEALDGGVPKIIYKRSKMNEQAELLPVHTRQFEGSVETLSLLRNQIKNAKVLELSNRQDTVSSDGPIWLLEINDHGRYRALYRADPDPGPFSKTCLSAAKVAGVSPEIQ